MVPIVADGGTWIARAWVPGRTLDAEIARRETVTLPGLVWLARGLAEGLMALHRAGVVHRDLKPSNIIIARYGPRINDFGSSAAIGSAAFAGTHLAARAAWFSSPEQLRGQHASPASDMYSLGAVLAYAARGARHDGLAWHQLAASEPGAAAGSRAADAARLRLLVLLGAFPLTGGCLAGCRGARPQAGSQRHPSLSSQTMASPSPATPETP